MTLLSFYPSLLFSSTTSANIVLLHFSCRSSCCFFNPALSLEVENHKVATGMPQTYLAFQ